MLTTMIVDENPHSLIQLANLCAASQKLGSVYIYSSAEQAMEERRPKQIEFALLCMKEPGIDQLKLGDWLREQSPGMVLFYITSSEHLCAEAVRHGADYIIMNPYQVKEIAGAIDRAILLYRRNADRLYVHTFGRFYVLHRGNAVCFGNRKSRELLALCVDRCGGKVDMEEAAELLWPGRPFDSRVRALYRGAVIGLRQTLNLLGQRNVFVSRRGECYVNPGAIYCDYYEYLNGTPWALRSYYQEYMYDFLWAEQTNIKLSQGQKEQNNETVAENAGGNRA